MSTLPHYDYELVFEDNASTDMTQDLLREICAKDKKVKAIFNQANYGIANSGTNVLMNLTGDAFISIPCDLQEPIEMIPELIGYWEEGYDVVWGQKLQSEESRLKYFCRGVYYKIIELFSEYKQIPQVTGFGIYDRTVLNAFLVSKVQDPQIYIRHFVAEYGFKLKTIPYKQKERKWGKSSYNMASSLSFAITSLCNTSTKPLRLMTILGIFTAFLSILIGCFYLVYKLTHWYSFDVGLAPMIIGLFFCSAVQLFCIGLLGEYISILLRKVSKKPIVIEKERLNFENNNEENFMPE